MFCYPPPSPKLVQVSLAASVLLSSVTLILCFLLLSFPLPLASVPSPVHLLHLLTSAFHLSQTLHLRSFGLTHCNEDKWNAAISSNQMIKSCNIQHIFLPLNLCKNNVNIIHYCIKYNVNCNFMLDKFHTSPGLKHSNGNGKIDCSWQRVVGSDSN